MTGTRTNPDQQQTDRPDDLQRNPGIGSSKGLFAREGAEDASLIEGENTFEGDVENDANAAGGVNTQDGRTND